MPTQAIFTYLLLSFTFLVSTHSKVFAQYEDLQNDPTITWIAAFTTDHNFSLETASTTEIIKLIKFYEDPVDVSGSNRSNWIRNWIVGNALDGKSDCYKDPGLTAKLSNKELKSITTSVDTVVTFDPADYTERIMIIQNDLDPKRIIKLRTNQIIYYNSKSEDFETRLISVAPLFESGKAKTIRPLFWIKMNDPVPSKLNIHAPEITWAGLGYSKDNPLELNFMEVVKNSENLDFTQFLFQQSLEMKKPIESSRCYGCKEFLTKREIAQMYNGIDTVTTFDPETFTEEIKIYKNELDPKDISQYRLVQEWYYDSAKKKLMNRLKAIAPIVNVKDANGVFRYSKALYYIRYNSWQ